VLVSNDPQSRRNAVRTPWLSLVLAAALVSGCDEPTAPRDLTPPAAPRGVYSVTGDGSVTLHWLGNTESDLALYRVYTAPCASGGACPYTRAGSTTATTFTITGLANAQPVYLAVAAVDAAGNESALSYETVRDVPRPAGSGLALGEFSLAPNTSGFDFSAFAVRPATDPSTDMYFATVSGVQKMICPFTDTDIQDAGFASTLDAVDVAPASGWSPSGAVELIPGHCYVVRIGSTVVNYGKFRVTGLSASQVILDWAYQTAPNEPELRARPAGDATPRERRPMSKLLGLLAVRGAVK
jgi:hypothetical protein